MSTTIGESISRIRSAIKGHTQDSFITDAELYSGLKKYASLLMRRQDNRGKIMNYDGIFQPIPCLNLTAIDRVDCPGIKLPYDLKIMRTVNPLPEIMDGYMGPLIRNVSTVDSGVFFERTTSRSYSRMISQRLNKYNQSKYYWIEDGHLYFPNITYKSVRLEAAIHADSSEDGDCRNIQERSFNIPDFLFVEVERMLIQELMGPLQIPEDQQHDLNNITRN